MLANFWNSISLADQLWLIAALTAIGVSVFGIYLHEKKTHQEVIRDYPMGSDL